MNHIGSPAPVRQPSTSLSALRLRVGEMDCPSCIAKIERHLTALDGIRTVEGSVLARTLSVVAEPDVSFEDLRRELATLGYGAELIDAEGPVPEGPSTWRTMAARRVYAATALALVGAIAAALTGGTALWTVGARSVYMMDPWLLGAALVGGWNFFPKGFAAARRLSLDMNFLMTVAIFGAIALGEFTEAAAIAVLFGLAELLETYSVDRARASVEALMEMAPDNAVVVRDGVEMTVRSASLGVGDEIVVRPGERVPADGTVLEGGSAVDQSPITGESMPVEKTPGDEVFSGTINREGHLRIRVDRGAGESALARIVRLIEEAAGEKSESERFVERFARYYTPAITVAAVATALLPPLLVGAAWGVWITRGLTLLVIACPCALVISTPVAVVSGLTAAARRGVVIKGGIHLESLGSIRAFAIDKTGTLTVGHPVVRQVISISDSEDEALAIAAAIESRSEHPLARAIVEEAQRRTLTIPARVDHFEALPGRGAKASVEGVGCVVGRRSLFPDTPPPQSLDENGHTVIGVARDGVLLAWIALADQPRPEAAAAISRLRAMDIGRIVMLTGDDGATAAAIGAHVGIDEVHAALMPADKLALLRQLQDEHGAVAMVGDGVNDGPALAAATVGIAMGAAGSDTALETADVALMGDDLERLPYLVELSRRARRVIRQNIMAAIGVKVVLAIGVPLGYVPLIIAVLVGDLGVSLLVSANALRLGRAE